MRVGLVLLSLLCLTACGSPAQPSASAPRKSVQASAAAPSAEPVSASPSAVPSPSASPSRKPSPKPPSSPVPATGVFSRTASGGTGVMGTSGTLRTYCVQVEDVVTTFGPDQVASVTDAVLGSDKSWTAGGAWRFQRVPSCASANLRIRLAIPPTVDRLCRPAANTEGKYSCRNGNDIFLNLDRWTYGVAHFPDLAVYRNMLVNHEVGHYLGKGHVSCPGAGQPAPVMQQQSMSLQGCTINPHPYPDGVTYYP